MIFKHIKEAVKQGKTVYYFDSNGEARIYQPMMDMIIIKPMNEEHVYGTGERFKPSTKGHQGDFGIDDTD